MKAHEFIEMVGRDNLASALKKGPETVRTSVYQGKGKLPPAWYDVCCKLARAKGKRVPPRAMFNFTPFHGGSK